MSPLPDVAKDVVAKGWSLVIVHVVPSESVPVNAVIGSKSPSVGSLSHTRDS